MVIDAANAARRSTASGLQQITPWLLRRAVENSTNHGVARALAQLATRWGNGELGSLVGALTASGRLLGLFKDEHKKDVSPIVISGSLRRLLTRAYTGGLKAKLRALTADHQLGV